VATNGLQQKSLKFPGGVAKKLVEHREKNFKKH